MNSNEALRDFLLEDIYSDGKFILNSDVFAYKCGRRISNEILTESILASREHCIFYRTDNGLGVADVGSFNGTYVNGVIQEPNVIKELNINDIIGIGNPGLVVGDSKLDFEKPTAYRLKFFIKNEAKPSVTSENPRSKDIEKNVNENKRKLSEHLLDFEVPCKIARAKEETSFPDITNVENAKIHGIEVSEVISSATSRDPRLNRTKSTDSLPKENGSSRSAKRVSFNDRATKIIIYEIKPGNTLKKCPSKDAPLLIKKSRRRNYANKKVCRQLEQFLSKIFRWNTNWLMEQEQYDGRIPLVVDEKRLTNVLSKYETYEDYYNVTEPLLTLELWHVIKRDYEIGEKNLNESISIWVSFIKTALRRRKTLFGNNEKQNEENQRCVFVMSQESNNISFFYYVLHRSLFMSSIVKNSISLTTLPSTNISVTTLMLEIVVSKRQIDLQLHPVYGDLVFFEYVSTATEKQTFCKIFAYVTSIRQTVITPLTKFNRDLTNFVEESYAVLTYTLMTKPLDKTHIRTNEAHGLRKITNLCSNIRTIEALQYLIVSPLLKQILHPSIEDYQLPMVKNYEKYPLVTRDKLNAKQLEAVVRITKTVVQQIPKICLIEGPPGTGKSKVIVNLVTEILYGSGRYHHVEPLRILVCSSSNAAIDEIVLRLLEVRRTISETDKENRFKMVRLGDSSTMHPLVRRVAIGELAKPAVKRSTARYLSRLNDESTEEEKRVLEARINSLELELLSVQTSFSLHPKRIMKKLDDAKAKYDLLMCRQSAEKLDLTKLASLQKDTEETLLAGADVIACTLESCYTNQMESVFSESDEAISVCIVDEATRCAEAETLVPLMLGVKTLILVGDTNQVPSTIKSQRAKHFGLDKSLFSRIHNTFMDQKKNPIIQLNTQYRMSYSVALWPNRYFFAGAMKNAANLHILPFTLYKVIDIDYIQKNDEFSNMEEAIFMANLVYTLMTSSKLESVSLPVRMGIITACDSRKALITKKIEERIEPLSNSIKTRIVHEVNTVEKFQGQERDIIIVSCVGNGDSGFLSDRQRLCVALTRAKHSMILCGNFEKFWRDPMCNNLLSDARSRRVYVKIKATALPEEIKPYVVR